MKKTMLLSISLIGMFLITASISKATAQENNRKEILLESMSPYEDLTEFALADDGVNVGKAIQALIASNSRKKTALPKRVFDHLSDNLEKMDLAKESGDHAVVALTRSIHTKHLLTS